MRNEGRRRSSIAMLEGGFWVFILEALLVLGLAIFIVWWTLPRKRKDDKRR